MSKIDIPTQVVAKKNKSTIHKQINLFILSFVLIGSITAFNISDLDPINAQMFQVVPDQQAYNLQFEQLRQNLAFLEQQLQYSNPQQQQFIISSQQQILFNELSQLDPQIRPQAIQTLQQAMSPQLSQILLAPVVFQLQGSQIGFNSPPMPSPNNPYPMPSTGNSFNTNSDQGLIEACMNGEMALSGNSYEYCKQVLNPNPSQAANICGYLGQVNVPVPGC